MNAARLMGTIAQALTIGVAVLLMTGCKTQEPIQFGIYSVPQAELKAAKSLGIDFVVGPRERDYLDTAEAIGLKVLGRGPGTATHPALRGIYLSDEPDLRGISPEAIRDEARRARRHSTTPLYLNLSSGYSIELYRDCADVLMFDWYPVGWKPHETYWGHCRAARLAAGKKPFFAVAQLFSWDAYPRLMPASKSYRLPTPAEVRAFTVWAAMNGAAGIVYYPFDDGHTQLEKSPALAEAVRTSIQLVRDHRDYFKGSRLWRPYPFDFTQPDDATNQVAETSIAVRFAPDARDKRSLLLTAANTTAKTIEVKWDSKINELAGGRMTFAPYEVRFFQLSK